MKLCLMPWSIFAHYFYDLPCDIYYLAPAFDGNISLQEYLPYFLKTVALELPIYLLILLKLKNWKQIFQINLLLNIATHPAVFFVISFICSNLNYSYLTYLITAETFAPVTEFLILIYFFKIPAKGAWVAAIAANLFSWSIGVWL